MKSNAVGEITSAYPHEAFFLLSSAMSERQPSPAFVVAGLPQPLPAAAATAKERRSAPEDQIRVARCGVFMGGGSHAAAGRSNAPAHTAPAQTRRAPREGFHRGRTLA